jgi:signal transduction histidine kinase
MNSHSSHPASISTLKTILIIDDDVHFAAMLAIGLEANGYKALHAADAAAGWRLAHMHLPDLILSDIDMPGKDGRRLLQDMRADSALADRQFVLMTGKAIFGGQRAAMDLGADDFLAKPFGLPDLLRCVAARLKRADLSRRLDDATVDRIGEKLRASLPRELFTPLASILGLSELLQRDFGEITPDETRRDLRDIHDAGQQLLRSLRNYLLTLELESAGTAWATTILEPEVVGTALTAGALAAGERQRRVNDIELELSATRVRAREADLRTIAEELVDNALKFSRRGTPVQVRVWRDGLVLQVVVADAGRGLSPQQLERLSAAWEQSGGGETRQRLRFGLMLVRRLAQLLDGTFRLESREGAGTTAYLTLPAAPD